MKGVALNLDASLEARYQSEGYAGMTERSQVPLAEAVRLVLREKLAGQEVPPSARQAVGYWRDFIENKLSGHYGKLSDRLADQDGFSRAVRDVIAALDVEPYEEADPDADAEQQEAKVRAATPARRKKRVPTSAARRAPMAPRMPPWARPRAPRRRKAKGRAVIR